MFHRVAKLVIARPKTVVISLVVFMLIAAGIGGGVISKLSSGGFDDPNSESSLAAKELTDQFKQQPNNLIVLVQAKDGSVNSASTSAAALAIENQLRSTQYVASVTSYWSAGKQPSLKSRSGDSAIIVATVLGTENQVAERIKTITPAFTRENNQLKTSVGGLAEINNQYAAQIEKDLKIAEAVAFPLTAIILIFVFRSLVAASLPLFVGGFALMGTFFILYLLTLVTKVNIYSLNLASMLSLGLAIDYSLFMVSRFREELAKGASVHEAVTTAVVRSGRTITFSAVTIALCLAALLVFPQNFLQSFAYAGIAVTIVALIGALFLLPAMLVLLGRNIDKWSIRKKAETNGSKIWHDIAHFVMKRPYVVAVTVVIFLVMLGLPFWRINAGQSDERALPTSNPVRVVHDTLRNDYDSREANALQIVSLSSNAVAKTAIDSYASELSRTKHVDHVEAGSGIYVNGERVSDPLPNGYVKTTTGSWLAVIPSVDPLSKKGIQLVKDIRAIQAPSNTKVGGFGPALVDLKASLADRLPWAFAVIVVSMFVLFFLAFGSVFLPFKALLTALLSLSASFGAMVWIFQEGHLSGVLNFTATGMIAAAMPILMFCIAFGLSMDYEMFLLSRIKEEHDRNPDTTLAVAHGLEKTGGIVTAAALSISIVFIAFATSGVMIIKMLGLGLAIAVLLDAFVIRATLVPAFMRIAGSANWWAPKPLKKLYERFSLSD